MFKGRMTAVLSIAVLEAHLLPLLRTDAFFHDNTHAVLQQDGDPKQTTMVQTKYTSSELACPVSRPQSNQTPMDRAQEAARSV